MASYLYLGLEGRDFPQDDGLHPSFTVQPGDTVEADENPDPYWFDLVDADPAAANATNADTAATITEPEPADVLPDADVVTEGTE